MSVTRGSVTPLAGSVDLGPCRNAGDADLAASFHHGLHGGIRRAPSGRQVFRGLPFWLARSSARRRWLLLDRPVSVDLSSHPPASHVVIAHFCDAWRDAGDGRSAGLPLGWVAPVGQAPARYRVEAASGTAVERLVRRRFEINDALVGWGQGAFAAVPHRTDEPLDWRGPHPALAPTRTVATGLAGLLGTLPGSWGPAQTGVADAVPSPTDDIVIWIHAIPVAEPARRLTRLWMEPLAPIAEGGGVVVAAVTLFRGSASPLVLEPRRTLRIEPAATPTVDLGAVFRIRRATVPTPVTGAPTGWGSLPASGESTAIDVDLAMAPDATIAAGSEVVPGRRLPPEGVRRRFGTLTIEALPTPTRRIDVRVVDAATGEPMPARVHVRAADGRYLPPLGHRDEINPGLNEDGGADVVIGATRYAYVPGRFPIELPAGTVHIEAVRGFGYRPIARSVDVATLAGSLDLPLEAVAGPSGSNWVAADCHVHFISPTSALLQAQAEGVAIVNLLATQWGDHHTSVADLPAAVVGDAAGRHLVVMGSENRQNMLGHIGLLGARDAVVPMSSAGAPEARLGDPLAWLTADWADAARAQHGLALAVHFPLPYAEVAADIVSGRIDAVEMQVLAPDADGPSIREWYRFLNCGYRLPIAGGTDKMSAEIPLGAIRTYARLDPGEPLTFEAWARAVRAGRTFVSSGSFVELAVEGCEPGETVRLGPRGGSVEVRAGASSALPVIDRLEIVHDGRVVAATAADNDGDRLTLADRIAVSKSGWLAARVTSRHRIHSAFATAMGAHSSPVYLEVRDRPAMDAGDAAAIATIIDGARAWVDQVATVRSPDERRRLARYFEESRAILDQLVAERSPSS